MMPQLNRTWLFNLAEDPGETKNLAEENPQLVIKMVSLLKEHDVQMVPPIWGSVGAVSRNVDIHLPKEPDPLSDDYIYWSN